jgi:hypothetical protein
MVLRFCRPEAIQTAGLPALLITVMTGPEGSNVKNTESSVTIRLSGGLGNQLFQYSAARSLAARNNCRLILDTVFFDSRRHRRYELHHFPVTAEMTGSPEQPRWRKWLASLSTFPAGRPSGPVYSEPHMHFDSAWKTLSAPVTLKGYFQSHKYFEEHDQLIRTELSPSRADDAESRRIEELLADSESVSVHIRRGDYVSNPSARKIYCECTREYYLKALARIPGAGPIVFFSDDIAWARSNISVPHRECIWAGEHAPRSGVSDLWLMSKARHHIIANSTFSWWGAWLSEREDGLTIAPAAWFRDSSICCDDLIPDEWVRL